MFSIKSNLAIPNRTPTINSKAKLKILILIIRIIRTNNNIKEGGLTAYWLHQPVLAVIPTTLGEPLMRKTTTPTTPTANYSLIINIIM